MFAKRLEQYRINFLETRIVSQLAIFPISLVSILSLYGLLKAGYAVPQYVESHQEYFSVSIIFHLLVAVLFGARFILLFFNSKKSFWLSQLIWILCLVTLFSWCAYTNHSFYGFFYESSQILHSGKLTFSEAPITNFSLVSCSLDKLGSTYFFLSPARQFFTFIISVFKRW